MNSHNCYILVSVYLQTQRTMHSRKHLVKNSQIQMCTVFLFWSLLCAILLQSNFYSYSSLSACRNIYFVFCKLVLHGISQPRIKLLLLFFVRLHFCVFALSELNIETGTSAQKWPRLPCKWAHIQGRTAQTQSECAILYLQADLQTHTHAECWVRGTAVAQSQLWPAGPGAQENRC